MQKDKRTKNLVGRLTSSDIAVIYHRDLDEVAAVHLAESKVKAVINCERSISGKFLIKVHVFCMKLEFLYMTIWGWTSLNK